jgi:hypothetical protein
VQTLAGEYQVGMAAPVVLAAAAAMTNTMRCNFCYPLLMHCYSSKRFKVVCRLSAFAHAALGPPV